MARTADSTKDARKRLDSPGGIAIKDDRITAVQQQASFRHAWTRRRDAAPELNDHNRQHDAGGKMARGAGLYAVPTSWMNPAYAKDWLDGHMAANRVSILLCTFFVPMRNFCLVRAGANPAKGFHGRW